MGAPSQGAWALLQAGREATEDPCHPSPLFALPELCQAKCTQTHTHLKTIMPAPPHPRPDLGPKETKENKACAHSDDFAGTAPLEQDVGRRRGEGINCRV